MTSAVLPLPALARMFVDWLVMAEAVVQAAERE
jgi:hypothetical protein